MNDCLADYFRFPESYECFAWTDHSAEKSGYFRFGDEVTCFGCCSGSRLASNSTIPLHDALPHVSIHDGVVDLPFNPSEIASNFYREAYVQNWRTGPYAALSSLYYLLRPALPVHIRRPLQKLYLRNWDKVSFPRWPVDCSVNNLLDRLMLLRLKASGAERIPFIWFWPQGKSACAIMTHDVETETGCRLCSDLMDVNDSFGIKASFQIIPEERYCVRPQFLDSIRSRGFEIAVHDLNHDGHLYKDRSQFLERAARINAYGREYGTRGFRAGVLYRKQIWYDALDFAYDMSVPNVAHLDPQHGGCCTIMPYFLGHILEIPVTTVQDYTLFHILHDYTITLWRAQAEIILKRHGLMSFIAHPDYSMGARELSVYKQLLAHIAELRQEHGVWVTTPGELNQWWRQRANMQLVQKSQRWTVTGPGSECARLAWAEEKDGSLVFTVENSHEQHDALTDEANTLAFAPEGQSCRFGNRPSLNGSWLQRRRWPAESEYPYPSSRSIAE
jgi:hypothetical protein